MPRLSGAQWVALATAAMTFVVAVAHILTGVPF